LLSIPRQNRNQLQEGFFEMLILVFSEKLQIKGDKYSLFPTICDAGI